MSKALDPPSEDDASADEPTGEPAQDDPPTPYEHMLVAEAGDAVGKSARWIARKFPRHVHETGLMTRGDFEGIGHAALYRAARVYREDKDTEFPTFAAYYVRGAMLDVIDDLLFEERLHHSTAKAEGRYGMEHTGGDYNVMKHDAEEAKRRYRAFANGLLAASFAAAMEQAAQHLDEAEAGVRRDFVHARAILERALARMPADEREMLALVYRGPPEDDPEARPDRGLDLKAASQRLGIPYGTARVRHARALASLHDMLVDEGITRAPRPLSVPYGGDLFGARAPPVNDTSEDERR